MSKSGGKQVLYEYKEEEILDVCKRAKTATDLSELAHIRTVILRTCPDLRVNNPPLYQRVCQAWIDLDNNVLSHAHSPANE